MAANIESIILKVRRYNPDANFALLRHAHDYATEKHTGQFRRSGEPYILHPIEVSDILAGLEMDVPSIAAGFLHDVIEDCGVSREEIAEIFGEEIAVLVDGVTKLKLADFDSRELETVTIRTAADREKQDADVQRRKKRYDVHSSAENLRKILLAMAKDMRVMVIKISDRLHNMRTLGSLSEERRRKNAQETMEIYAPLAHRLGIWQVKWQLEDLAFKHLYPEEYQSITEQVARTRKEREKDIRDAIYQLKKAFEDSRIEVEIQGRPKHLWSIYNKIRKQEIDFQDIYDLIALRVIVNTVPDCYAAVGIVHTLWLPIPGKFDDYIAKKKPNLYQSIHTKVYGPRDQRLEVQIRTWEMHRVAEYGVAAHWAYKERGEGAKAGGDDFERKMAFLRQQLFDWQQDAKDSSEFLSTVTGDLFTDQVFVFTPKGDVIDMPAGGTPVDFAYRVHTDVGEHIVGAKVNGKIVPIDYEFHNGDICAVITRPQAKPSLDWLSFVKSSHARNKIKGYFRKQRYSENVVRGRDLLHDELHQAKLSVDVLKNEKKMLPIANALNKESVDDLFAAVGFGDTALGMVINRLRQLEQEEREKQRAAVDGEDTEIIRRRSGGEGKLSIAPGGVDGVAITRGKCCKPLPGDEVIGYVSRGKGMVLHRDGCANVANWRLKEPERLIGIDWQADARAKFDSGLIIETLDRVGLLRDVTEIFSENKAFILSIHTKSNVLAGTATMRVDLQVSSVEEINALIRRLHNLADLIAIYRLGVGAEETPSPSREA